MVGGGGDPAAAEPVNDITRTEYVRLRNELPGRVDVKKHGTLRKAVLMEVHIDAPSNGSREFAAVVVGGKVPLEYQWKIGNGQWTEWRSEPNYTMPDGSKKRVKLHLKVKDALNEEELAEPVEVPPAAKPKPSSDVPNVWSWKVATIAGAALVVLYFATLAALQNALGSLLRPELDKTGFTGALVMVLVAVGLLALLAGVYLAILEFRGKSTALDSLKDVSGTPDQGSQADALASLKLPEVLKEFRQFRNTLAIVLVAIVCFTFALILAYQAQITIRSPAGNTALQASVSTTPAGC